jgi:hypothetical protein
MSEFILAQMIAYERRAEFDRRMRLGSAEARLVEQKAKFEAGERRVHSVQHHSRGRAPREPRPARVDTLAAL